MKERIKAIKEEKPKPDFRDCTYEKITARLPKSLRDKTLLNEPKER